MSPARTLRTTVTAWSVGVLLLLTPATAATADTRRSGSCSGPSDWQLNVRRDDAGKLRVKLEIEGGAASQDWHIFISDNGSRIFSGTRTSSTGGHVEVRTRTADQSGSDAIKAAANNVVTGETCVGRMTF